MLETKDHRAKLASQDHLVTLDRLVIREKVELMAILELLVPQEHL